MADIRQPIGGNNDRNSLMVDLGNETYADATAIVGPSGHALDPGADGSLPVSVTGGAVQVGVVSTDVNNAITADVDAAVAAAANLRLMGYACRESAATAAAATFHIVKGATGAGGTRMVPVELGPDQAASEWFGPQGLDAAAGISIDWVAGTVDVELFHGVAA